MNNHGGSSPPSSSASFADAAATAANACGTNPFAQLAATATPTGSKNHSSVAPSSSEGVEPKSTWKVPRSNQCSQPIPNSSEKLNSSKKRTKTADSVDDILGQSMFKNYLFSASFLINCFSVCSKISTLSTQDSSSSHTDMIQAFMEVLECSAEEAAFFLESTVWSLEDAVVLYLDTNRNAMDSGKKHRIDTTVTARAYQPHVPMAMEYKRKQIFIHGLPDGWSAWVSRLNGTVFFMHDATGHTQPTVPPGFADIDTASDADVAVAVDVTPAPDAGEGSEMNEDMEVWGILAGPTPTLDRSANPSAVDKAMMSHTADSTSGVSHWMGSTLAGAPALESASEPDVNSNHEDPLTHTESTISTQYTENTTPQNSSAGDTVDMFEN
jgi:hypothetical protein